MSSLAANMPADADVFPVEAQIILRAPVILACVTADAIPLSLKEPLGLYPSVWSSMHPSSMPASSDALFMW